MTTPIAPRTEPRIPPPDPNIGRPTEKAPTAPPRELPELPDTHAQAIANAVNAHLGRSRAIEAPRHYVEEVHLPPVEARLDAFRESASATYQVPELGPVKVAIPFRMAVDPHASLRGDWAELEMHVRDLRADLEAIAGQAGLTSDDVQALTIGRSTPEKIERVTQALLDARRLPPAEGKLANLDLAGRVRTMMCRYGIGLDCAGYAQQAFLASRGLTRSQTTFKQLDLENLSGLSSRGFARVRVEDTRPGDLVVLRRPSADQVGHTGIVRSSAVATQAELEQLAKRVDISSLDRAPVQKVVVDSSWGNSADPVKGGVKEQTWWRGWGHDEHGKVVEKWVSEDTDGAEIGNGPYGHALEGFYRPATEK